MEGWIGRRGFRGWKRGGGGDRGVRCGLMRIANLFVGLLAEFGDVEI